MIRFLIFHCPPDNAWSSQTAFSKSPERLIYSELPWPPMIPFSHYPSTASTAPWLWLPIAHAVLRVEPGTDISLFAIVLSKICLTTFLSNSLFFLEGRWVLFYFSRKGRGPQYKPSYLTAQMRISICNCRMYSETSDVAFFVSPQGRGLTCEESVVMIGE